MKRYSLTLVVVLLVAAGARHARRADNELYWEAIIAAQLHAEAEHRLPCGARVDLLTPTAAIEIDWPKKWAEGVGQALYYGAQTNRRAVVLYLVSDPVAEARYLDRARVAADAGGVEIWLWDCRRRAWIVGPTRAK